MNRVFITFRSVTPAQQAQRILSRAGMDAVLQRTPRTLEQAGCGYCLRLPPEKLGLAVELLRHSGISFRKIYTEETGQMQELSL